MKPLEIQIEIKNCLKQSFDMDSEAGIYHVDTVL